MHAANLGARGTRTVYNKVDSFDGISTRDWYLRDFVIVEALDFAARIALEMDVVMVVAFRRTSGMTQSVGGCPTFIRYAMKNTRLKEAVQGSV